MYVKKHVSEDRTVVAICDEDILGKKFTKGDIQLEVFESFYGGDKKTDDEVRELLCTCDNLNIVGKKVVKLALEVGVVNLQDVMYIGELPYTLIVGI